MPPIVGAVYQKEINGNLISIFDCEPSGLLVIVKNGDGEECTLSPSKYELDAAHVGKNAQGYEKLAASLSLTKNDFDQLQIESSLKGIRNAPPSMTAGLAETYLTKVPAGKETLPDLLARGLTELCREKPVGLDAIEWLGNWLLNNNPNQPRCST